MKRGGICDRGDVLYVQCNFRRNGMRCLNEVHKHSMCSNVPAREIMDDTWMCWKAQEGWAHWFGPGEDEGEYVENQQERKDYDDGHEGEDEGGKKQPQKGQSESSLQ